MGMLNTQGQEISGSTADWYTSNLGKVGDKEGIDYWTSERDKEIAAGGTGEETFKTFEASAKHLIGEGVEGEWGAQYEAPKPATATPSYQAPVTTQAAPATAAAVETATFDKPYEAKTVDQSIGRVDPITREVQREETVAGQMEGLLAEDSDFRKRSRATADQEMVSRGLLSSSMAVGAARAADIDAVLAIATADANTYFTQATNNQEVANLANKLNAGTEIDLAKYDADTINEARKLEAQYELQNQQFNAEQKNKANQNYADATNKLNELQVDGEIQGALKEVAGQFDLVQNMDSITGRAHQSTVETVNSIYADPNITTDEAKALANSVIEATAPIMDFADAEVQVSLPGAATTATTTATARPADNKARIAEIDAELAALPAEFTQYALRRSLYDEKAALGG